MKDPRSGRDLVIAALEKEFRRLSAVAEKKKAECDECFSAPTDLLEVRRKASEILETLDPGTSALKKLKTLAEEETRLLKLIKKSSIDFMDAQHLAEAERDNLGQELSFLKFRYGVK